MGRLQNLQSQDLLQKCFRVSVLCFVAMTICADYSIPAIIHKRLPEAEYIKQRSLVQHEIAVQEFIKTRFPDRGKFAKTYSKAVVKIAEKHDVKIPVIVGIASVESSWNHKAVSSKKAVGLMQVLPSIWCETLKQEGLIKSKKDLFKPEHNLEAGVFIYKTYKEGYKKAKNPSRKALHRYSGGHVGYVDKVFAEVEGYKAFKKELFKRG